MAKSHPPLGATVRKRTVHFRVWAPKARKVAVVFAGTPSLRGGKPVFLRREGAGYFAGAVEGAKEGDHYKYKLDHRLYPDPVSRFQPEGPHGPSQVVNPRRFRWTDREWLGVARENQVIYEMHVGTFTEGGTWQGALAKLPYLVELGVTVLELMPVCDFPGRYGWGYDGVNFFAPTRLYGEPDDFRAFVDAAHAQGIGVILDVVYNHVGPDGNYLQFFSPDYFTDRYKNEWGEALNFDGKNSGPVREFFLANAEMWIREYHLDGLRLDATQQIFDQSKEHFLAALEKRTRRAAGQRKILLIAENEPQDSKLVRSREAGGFALDALWNDDLHHSAIVALTGRNEAYYSDHRGTPQEFISAAKWGYLYQGQHYTWQKNIRGTASLDLTAANFVNFIQNHDQVANSLRGHRIHLLSGPGSIRAMTAMLLLLPGTPMLFQGQEFAASTPFLYFADHNPKLAKLVAKGRAEFLRQFPSIAQPEAEEMLQNPEKEETFLKCKLDFSDREKRREIFDLHRDLIALRRGDPVIGGGQAHVDGAVLGADAFLIRYFGGEGGDRLLVVNLGKQTTLAPIPEPLMAPPADREWQQIWSSEDVRYGGGGMPPLESGRIWPFIGHVAALLTSIPKKSS